MKKLLLLSLLLTACHNPVVQNSESGAIDCGKQAFSNLIPEVASALSQGGSFESNLESIGLKEGEKALACAVQAVIGALSAHPVGSGSNMGVTLTALQQSAIANGNAYITKKHWTFK